MSITDGSVADQATADAFATSWNNLPAGSVYTREQFEDWLAPLTSQDARGRRVLELGCGNGSLMVHMTGWNPAALDGVDLGDSVVAAQRNLERTGFPRFRVLQADLTGFTGGGGYELVYCIGVLHHLTEPERGFAAVVRNVAPGGRFHCWVYAREGNGVVIALVEPLRRVACRLPWWLTKHVLATALVAPYYLYAKTLAALARRGVELSALPLYDYSRWIARRGFAFFRHVAFDQLVTPRTTYLQRSQIEAWLKRQPEIDAASCYLVQRNGNSWKFGGRVRPR